MYIIDKIRYGQLQKPAVFGATGDGPGFDTVIPRSYIRWISSLHSVNDLSGMVEVSSTTSPIFSLHFGSFTRSWFTFGLNSSFVGKPWEVHLELPRPHLSIKSMIVEFAGNSCTDICSSKYVAIVRLHHLTKFTT